MAESLTKRVEDAMKLTEEILCDFETKVTAATF